MKRSGLVETELKLMSLSDRRLEEIMKEYEPFVKPRRRLFDIAGYGTVGLVAVSPEVICPYIILGGSLTTILFYLRNHTGESKEKFNMYDGAKNVLDQRKKDNDKGIPDYSLENSLVEVKS